MRRFGSVRVHVAHGTWTRYARDRCRCAECQAVSRAHGSGQDNQTGDLLSYCWCGMDQVVVTRGDVLNGRTKSCGRQACEAVGCS